MAKVKQNVSPRKQPKQSRSQETVDIILKASTHIIEQFGLENMSTNKIAEKAGVSIGSLYQYFPNKEAIMAKLMDKYTERQLKLVEKALAKNEPQNLKEAIQVIIEVILKSKSHQLQLTKVIAENFSKLGRVEHIQEMYQSFVKIFKIAIVPYQDEVRDGNLDIMLLNCIQSTMAISVSVLYSSEYSVKDKIIREELVELIYRYLRDTDED